MSLVEDEGTFSVRGDIIDVFPTHAEHPYRIELYGDLVEAIRAFDPVTQRTELLRCEVEQLRRRLDALLADQQGGDERDRA